MSKRLIKTYCDAMGYGLPEERPDGRWSALRPPTGDMRLLTASGRVVRDETLDAAPIDALLDSGDPGTDGASARFGRVKAELERRLGASLSNAACERVAVAVLHDILGVR